MEHESYNYSLQSYVDVYSGDLCDNKGLVLEYLLTGAMSLHHLAVMTQPSLSCRLYFLSMLTITMFKMQRLFTSIVYSVAAKVLAGNLHSSMEEPPKT